MKPARNKKPSRPAPPGQLAELRARLTDAEETLRAIRGGEVDAMIGTGKQSEQVYTLQSADHAYRTLVESMNEGAVTILPDGVVLYANQCFARLVARPLEQVIGSSFRSFLSEADKATLTPMLERVGHFGAKVELLLHTGDGVDVPVRISICPLGPDHSDGAALCLVVTDMTEARQSEAMLRDLARRLVQAQEIERGRVANELRVNITQLLYGLLGRCESLAEKLPANLSALNGDTTKIKEMVQMTAEEVERIWSSLWSHELEKLGLLPALERAKAEFVKRTGVPVRIVYPPLSERLPGEIEMALYRILQKALSNVEQHARARHVTVELTRPDAFVQLTITDDGIGFRSDRDGSRRKRVDGVVLVGMRERAAYVGGVLTVESSPRSGTKIQVRVPLPPSPTALN